MTTRVDAIDALGGAFVLPQDRDGWLDGRSLIPGTLAERDRTEAPRTAEERRMRAVSQREAEWVRAAAGGSMAAFELIVRRYERPIVSLILRKVRDAGTAEDLAQETFIKAHRALETFDPDRRLASWLFKIANNTAIDHLRRRRLPTEALENGSETRRSLADTLPDEETLTAEKTVEGKQLGLRLATALDGLREDYREVLVLRFIEGLSYLEVAEVTDQPLGTVKTKIHRARRDLALALEEAVGA